MLLPEDTDGAQELFRTLGRQIRILRERAGLSRKQLGQRLGYSEDTISSVEQGRRTPQPELLVAADEFLGAGGLLATAGEDVERAKAKALVKHPSWFRDYARLERSAAELHYFRSLTMPGLLQTETYARTTFMVRQPMLDAETIAQRVAARLDRQSILTQWPPPMLTAVIDESVLRRGVGGEAVRREQLAKLLELGQLRNISIHVLPMACEDHAALEGPFILLTPKGRQQIGYLEVQDENRLVTDPEAVRILAARYGCLRGQALPPRESLTLIEKMLGE